MKKYGIVDSGDAVTLGIGAMTDARMKGFFDEMVRAGVVKAGLDYRKAYTLQIRRQEGRARSAAETMTMAPATASRPDPLVALRGVGKAFPSGTQALKGFDFDVRAGEFVSLLGPSGCGKSTALRIIAGLSEPSEARSWPARARTLSGESRIGFVFQEPTLMPWTSVFNNVLLPLKLKGIPAEKAGASSRRSTASAWRSSARLSARIVGRHAHARVDRARAGHRAAAAADGRAVRRARRDHALQAQRRPRCRCGRRCAPRSCSSPIRCSSRSICRAASW